MGIETLTPAMLAAIEGHLSTRAGAPVTIEKAESASVVSASRRRSFHTLWTREIPLVLHAQQTRWAMRRPDGHSLDAYLTAQGAPVARFHGWVRAGSRIVALWDHCEGAAHRSFDDYTDAQVADLVDAVAAVFAMGEAAQDKANISVGMRWVRPIVQEIIDSLGQTLELKDQTSIFLDALAMEKQFLARLEAQTIHGLNHNDLVARNILLRSDDLTIIDWDSASIGPPGAALRSFAFTPRAEAVAARFALAMADHGVSLDPAEVLFVMRAQQTFWFLTSGCVKRRPHRIIKGLNRLLQFHQDLT